MLTYSSIDVAFCRTKCNRLAVIYEDYYFHHNRRYKDGHYWCCAHRSCKVRLISNGQLAFSRRNNRLEHQHPPNAPNLIDKEFRSQLLQQLGRQPNSSVRHVYDNIYQSAIDRGVPEKLIPSFWSVRSTMYRLKPNNRVDDDANSTKSDSNNLSMESSNNSSPTDHQQEDSLKYSSRSVDGEESSEPDTEEVGDVDDEQVDDFYAAPQEEPLSLVKPKIQLPEPAVSPPPLPPPPPPPSPLPPPPSTYPQGPGPSLPFAQPPVFVYDYSTGPVQQQQHSPAFARIPLVHPHERLAIPNFTPQFLHHSWDLYADSLRRLESLRMMQLLPSFVPSL